MPFRNFVTRAFKDFVEPTHKAKCYLLIVRKASTCKDISDFLLGEVYSRAMLQILSLSVLSNSIAFNVLIESHA